MDTIWMIKTRGDPLSAIRLFLYNLWFQIDLDGIILPFYREGETDLKPRLAREPAELLSADPFLPVVSFNAARLVAELNEDHPGAYFGRAGLVDSSIGNSSLVEYGQPIAAISTN